MFTSRLAIVRSFSLLSWLTLDSRAKAWSAVNPWRSIKMPCAWPIRFRVVTVAISPDRSLAPSDRELTVYTLHREVVVHLLVAVVATTGIEVSDFRIQSSVLGNCNDILSLEIEAELINAHALNGTGSNVIANAQVFQTKVSTWLDVITYRNLAARTICCIQPWQQFVVPWFFPAIIQHATSSVTLEGVEVGPVACIVGNVATGFPELDAQLPGGGGALQGDVGELAVRSAMAPSALETTFWVTTSTSSSRAVNVTRARLSAIR